MDKARAIHIIGHIRYRPGWSIEVEPDFVIQITGKGHITKAPDSPPDQVRIRIRWTAPDSSLPPDFPQNTEVGLTTHIQFHEDDTDLRFTRRVLDALIALDMHEAREFFRIGVGDPDAPPNGVAPFHPHRVDGRSNWNATNPNSPTRTIPAM